MGIEHRFEISTDNDPNGVSREEERQKMAGGGKFPVKFNLTRNCSLSLCFSFETEESSLKGKRPSGGYYSIIHPSYSAIYILSSALHPYPKIPSSVEA